MKKLIVAASAALLATVSATPAAAQDAETKEERERIIILDKDGAEQKDGKVRSFHIRRHGGKDGPLHAMIIADCSDGEKVELDEGSDKAKRRIVFCGKNMTAEERAKKLEEIRGKLASREPMSEEHRARMIESLERALERLRNKK